MYRLSRCLVEVFEVYVRNIQCKHIIFGGSADNGYARLLSQYTEDGVADHITMLEGPPFAQELAQIVHKFRHCTFEGVIRDTKLPNRRVSFSTTISRSTSPKTPSYAVTVASVKSELHNEAAQPKVSRPATGMVARNRQGQRVDVPIKTTTAARNSIKGHKFCYEYYLIDKCQYPRCSYEHDAPLDAAQKNALRIVLRQSACLSGLDCGNPDCLFGHRCPADSACNGGKKCKFAPEMHNVDTKVVNC